jgi:hypothetical protein
MNGKAEAAMKQLSSLSKSLNEVSDQLNKQIAEIESALNAYKLGISAWVELKREQEQTQGGDGKFCELTHVEEFGYGKYNGKWGLLHSSYYEEFLDPGDPQSVQTTFFRDASREIRLAAVEKIPELLSALSGVAAKTTDEVLKKTAAAKEIAGALGRKSR